MLKKTITDTNFDGEEKTKDFYFNISKAEIGNMQMSTEGGLEKLFRDLIDTHDEKKQAKLFNDLILSSYGEVSKDGDFFMKTDAEGHRLADKFAQSAAYSELFIELATDTNKFIKFVIGILPKDFQKALIDSGWDKKDFNDPNVVNAVVVEAKKEAAEAAEANKNQA